MRPGTGTIALLALLGGAAACAPRPGALDPQEGCRAQLSSFMSSGDGFVAPAQRRPRWLPPRPAAQPVRPVLQTSLDEENAQIEALQIAFDSLLYCRWIEARTIRADIAARRVTREEGRARLQRLKARVNRDLARAREVLAAMERRAAEREGEIEAIAPGTRQVAQRAQAERGRVTRVVAAATVPLRLRPEAGAPEIGRVAAGDPVTVRPAQSGFALVEGRDGTRGYAPLGAFQAAERAAAGGAGAAGAGDGEVRRLAATNIARRDNFAESITLATQAAESGFELAT